MIRATFEVAPPGSAGALARRQSTGLEDGPDHVRGRVVAEDGELAVLEFPASNWGANVPLLVSTLVAGEVTEMRAFTRCRLVDLELPDDLLPGPAFGAPPGPPRPPGPAPATETAAVPPTGTAAKTATDTDTETDTDTATTTTAVPHPAPPPHPAQAPHPAPAPHVAPPPAQVGLIVKPQLGLDPDEFAAVAELGVAAGADLIKDDEILGDPPWCRLEDRVRAVAAILRPGVVYCPNVTGPTATLIERAARAVELGATGLMVNAFAQGLDSVLALRQAGLGVPILAHRAGSGPYARNADFGATNAVLARLMRLCGADHIVVGCFAGSLFDDDCSIEKNISAVRDPCGRARPSVALLGGGVGPHNAAEQVARAGGDGLMVLLGTAAYEYPGGAGEAVRATVEALTR